MQYGVGGRPWGKGVSVLFLVVIFSTQVYTTFTCPKDCFCAPHSKNVQCANKNFVQIPEEIPVETLELNLNENKFKSPSLIRRNFTQLYKLQNLYLSDCGIETIDVDTFADLNQLTWLDISKNKIRFLADHTFRGLNLKHLFINDNPDIQLSLGAFAGMTTQGLYMHNCGLKRLFVDLMTPLNSSLKTLWLHENHFEAFSEKWLYFFRRLAHIRLGKNAFHCNCQIKWLYTFYKNSKNSIFAGAEQPECGSPRLVQGKYFDEITEEDFRCELPTFQNVDAIFDTKMGKLTCQASGDPAPTLYWIRPDGTTETYYPQVDSKENSGVMFMTDVKLENKDLYKCVASNPAGNVTFSLNVVWPDLRLALTPKPGKLATTNIIRDDSTSAPVKKTYKNYAGDDAHAYDWANLNSESSKLKLQEKPVPVVNKKDKDHSFGIVDIIGAVIGTFLLTLLVSLTAFHLYYKQRERREEHYSVPDELKCTAHTVYIMNEPEENRIKMINPLNTSDIHS
ncbi:leucine-rich repeat and fibronectin type-III domain-containing protein 5 [Biomphalaria pfeifferi]|uniref:Leucine-rich repeat and fibronectin type-III domain-containing protein 5 n=1 Tax=Biomphalaria pfeifferi TaxID=112525 RepID=A0AAD8CCM7_BIOPF|nr:leucine-rich repeat and fibronectin type-III domain-containing protein 5 [Biomphalaria pfeifferi]